MDAIQAAFDSHRRSEPKAFSLRLLHEQRTPTLFCLGPVDEDDVEAYEKMTSSDFDVTKFSNEDFDKYFVSLIKSPSTSDSAAYLAEHGFTLESDVTFLRYFDDYLRIVNHAQRHAVAGATGWAGYVAYRKGVLAPLLDAPEAADEVDKLVESQAAALSTLDGETAPDPDLLAAFRVPIRNRVYHTLLSRLVQDGNQEAADCLLDLQEDREAYFADYLAELSGGVFDPHTIAVALRADYNPDHNTFSMPNPNPLKWNERATPRPVHEIQTRLITWLLSRWGRVIGRDSQNPGGWLTEAVTPDEVGEYIPATMSQQVLQSPDGAQSPLLFQVLRAAKLLDYAKPQAPVNSEVAAPSGKAEDGGEDLPPKTRKRNRSAETQR